MNVPKEYAIWAPDDSPWSAWAKPVLFTQLRLGTSSLPQPVEVPWSGRSDDQAVVVDLPGGQAIAAGLALARRGYRPVPLFNGVFGSAMLVDVRPLLAGLRAGAPMLAQMSLPPEAPPAFLLDANRRNGNPRPTTFDNRWATMPQDFPSGNRLRAEGIASVLVWRTSPSSDLDDVLARWQRSGLRLLTVMGQTVEPLRVAGPSPFGLLFRRLLVIAGLRRSSAGGFGALIPEPSQSGSRFG